MNATDRLKWIVGLAALCAALPYAAGGAVWDDHTLIHAVLAQLDGAGILELWTRPVGGGEVGTGYYRPLAMTVMALLGRGGVFPIHLLAALLHAGSALLLHSLLIERRGALVGALLFAVHPLASEALGWASALPDVLSVHLGLWSVWLARRNLVAAAVLVAGSALSKEPGLLLLPAAILGGLAPRRAGIAWGLGAAVALGARVMAGTGGAWDAAGKLELIPTALLWPIGSLLVPWPLTPVRDLLAAPGWVLPLGACVLIGAALAARRQRLAWAGLGLMVAAPLLALPPTLTGYLAAERYAYPALVGAAFWLAAVVDDRRSVRIIALALALASIGVHALQARVWRTDVALFEHATRALPESSYAWHFLGLVHQRSGRHADAADALEEAVRTGHPHPEDRLQATKAMISAGEPERALKWVSEGPQDGLTAEDIGVWAMAAWQAGQPQEARRLLTLLRTPSGYDGPPWVSALAADVFAE